MPTTLPMGEVLSTEEDRRVVALINPVGSKLVHERREALCELGSLVLENLGEFVTLETDPDDQTTINSVVKTLRKGDILIPFGGDGVFKVAASALRHPDLDDDLRGTLVVPGLHGNANLIGKELAKSADPDFMLSDLLKYGQAVQIWGTDITVESEQLDEAEELLAMACEGVNSGLVGENLNGIRMSKLRKWALPRAFVDGNAGLKGLRQTPVIEMQVNGEEIEAVAQIGVNTAYYLKFLNTPSSTAERAFHTLTVDKSTYPYIARTLFRYQSGELDWQKVKANESMIYVVTSKPGQQLTLDVDAEPYYLPSDEHREVTTVITMRPSATPVNSLTTNQELIPDQSAA